ncbi:hypothetical protein ScPMuIL_006013 [Solemya velum]
MSLVLRRKFGFVASRCLHTWCRRAEKRLYPCQALGVKNTSSRGPGLLSSGHLVRQAVCSQVFRGLQTEGDKELAEFLKKEIQLEKDTAKFKKELPKIPGWDVATKGCNIKLTSTHDNETITVTFNLNHSVESDEPPVINDKGDDDVAHVVSKPPFLVEISKPGTKKVAVQCSFPPHEDDLMDDPSSRNAEEETFMDQFEMNEVSLYDGEQTDEVFTVDSETMDGTLYDLVMDMLDERGINEDFISQLVDFATTCEHGKYITFLEELKTFSETK